MNAAVDIEPDEVLPRVSDIGSKMIEISNKILSLEVKQMLISADGRDKDSETENLLQLVRELAAAREQRSNLLQMLASMEQYYEKQYNDVLVVVRAYKIYATQVSRVATELEAKKQLLTTQKDKVKSTQKDKVKDTQKDKVKDTHRDKHQSSASTSAGRHQSSSDRGHSAHHSSSKSSSQSRSKASAAVQSRSESAVRSAAVVDSTTEDSSATKKTAKRESTSFSQRSSQESSAASVDPVLAVVHSVKPAAMQTATLSAASSIGAATALVVSAPSVTAASGLLTSLVPSIAADNQQQLASLDLLPSLTQLIASLAATIEQHSAAAALPSDADTTLTLPPLTSQLHLKPTPALGLDSTKDNSAASQVQREINTRTQTESLRPILPAIDMHLLSDIIGSANSLAPTSVTNSTTIASNTMITPLTVPVSVPVSTTASTVNNLSTVPPSALNNLNVDSKMLSQILSQFGTKPTAPVSESKSASQLTTSTVTTTSNTPAGLSKDVMSSLLQSTNLDLLKSAVAAVNKERLTPGGIRKAPAADTDLLKSAGTASLHKHWMRRETMEEDEVENACYYLPVSEPPTVVKETKDLVTDTVRALYDDDDSDSDVEQPSAAPDSGQLQASQQQEHKPYTSGNLIPLQQKQTTLPFLDSPPSETFKGDLKQTSHSAWKGGSHDDLYLRDQDQYYDPHGNYETDNLITDNREIFCSDFKQTHDHEMEDETLAYSKCNVDFNNSNNELENSENFDDEASKSFGQDYESEACPQIAGKPVYDYNDYTYDDQHQYDNASDADVAAVTEQRSFDEMDSNYKLAHAILSKMAAVQPSAFNAAVASTVVDQIHEPTPDEYAASIENASECDSTTVSAYDDSADNRFAANSYKNPRWQHEDDWQTTEDAALAPSSGSLKKAARSLLQELHTVQALLDMFPHRKKSFDSNSPSVSKPSPARSTGNDCSDTNKKFVQENNNFPRGPASNTSLSTRQPGAVTSRPRQPHVPLATEASRNTDTRSSLNFPRYRAIEAGALGPRLSGPRPPLPRSTLSMSAKGADNVNNQLLNATPASVEFNNQVVRRSGPAMPVSGATPPSAAAASQVTSAPTAAIVSSPAYLPAASTTQTPSHSQSSSSSAPVSSDNVPRFAMLLAQGRPPTTAISRAQSTIPGQHRATFTPSDSSIGGSRMPVVHSDSLAAARPPNVLNTATPHVATVTTVNTKPGPSGNAVGSSNAGLTAVSVVSSSINQASLVAATSMNTSVTSCVATTSSEAVLRPLVASTAAGSMPGSKPGSIAQQGVRGPAPASVARPTFVSSVGSMPVSKPGLMSTTGSMNRGQMPATRPELRGPTPTSLLPPSASSTPLSVKQPAPPPSIDPPPMPPISSRPANPVGSATRLAQPALSINLRAANPIDPAPRLDYRPPNPNIPSLLPGLPVNPRPVNPTAPRVPHQPQTRFAPPLMAAGQRSDDANARSHWQQQQHMNSAGGYSARLSVNNDNLWSQEMAGGRSFAMGDAALQWRDTDYPTSSRQLRPITDNLFSSAMTDSYRNSQPSHQVSSGWDTYTDSDCQQYSDFNYQQYEHADLAVPSLGMDEIDQRLAHIERRRAMLTAGNSGGGDGGFYGGNYGPNVADNSQRRSRPSYGDDELLPKRPRNNFF